MRDVCWQMVFIGVRQKVLKNVQPKDEKQETIVSFDDCSPLNNKINYSIKFSNHPDMSDIIFFRDKNFENI